MYKAMRNVCAICKTREAAKDRERVQSAKILRKIARKLGKKQKVVPR